MLIMKGKEGEEGNDNDEASLEELKKLTKDELNFYLMLERP
jgi:hypothetical protein